MTTRAERGWPSEVLVPAVLAGAFFGPAVEALDGHSSGGPWSWWGALVRGVLFAVVLVLLPGLRAGSPGTAPERAAVRRAVSAGALPEEADEEWPGRLAAHRRRLRSSRAGVPVVSALGASVVAGTTLLPGGSDGWGWSLAGGLVLAGALVAVREHRRLQAADRLQAALEERPTSA